MAAEHPLPPPRDAAALRPASSAVVVCPSWSQLKEVCKRSTGIDLGNNIQPGIRNYANGVTVLRSSPVVGHYHDAIDLSGVEARPRTLLYTLAGRNGDQRADFPKTNRDVREANRKLYVYRAHTRKSKTIYKWLGAYRYTGAPLIQEQNAGADGVMRSVLQMELEMVA